MIFVNDEDLSMFDDSPMKIQAALKDDRTKGTLIMNNSM